MSGRIGDSIEFYYLNTGPDAEVGPGVGQRARDRPQADLRLPVTAGPGQLRVLAIGDPYMPVTCFAEALAGLGEAVTVTQMQISRTDAEPPRTESERRLREYAGDPAEVARAVAGHDVVVVHGAPVSAEALDVPGLRLVCCARGGPVNVDVAAATERGIPVANTPGKNARGGRRADHLVRAAADPRRAPGQQIHLRRRHDRRVDVRGQRVLRPRGARHRARARRPRPCRAARGDAGRSRSAST